MWEAGWLPLCFQLMQMALIPSNVRKVYSNMERGEQQQLIEPMEAAGQARAAQGWRDWPWALAFVLLYLATAVWGAVAVATRSDVSKAPCQGAAPRPGCKV